MESEYQKQMEIAMEEIIVMEASIITLKDKKRQADREFEKEKARLEKIIKGRQHDIAILEQTGCDQITDIALDNWIEEEVEKEHKRWKNLTPQEKMKEHKERIDMLREAEKQRWYCS